MMYKTTTDASRGLAYGNHLYKLFIKAGVPSPMKEEIMNIVDDRSDIIRESNLRQAKGSRSVHDEPDEENSEDDACDEEADDLEVGDEEASDEEVADEEAFSDEEANESSEDQEQDGEEVAKLQVVDQEKEAEDGADEDEHDKDDDEDVHDHDILHFDFMVQQWKRTVTKMKEQVREIYTKRRRNTIMMAEAILLLDMQIDFFVSEIEYMCALDIGGTSNTELMVKILGPSTQFSMLLKLCTKDIMKKFDTMQHNTQEALTKMQQTLKGLERESREVIASKITTTQTKIENENRAQFDNHLSQAIGEFERQFISNLSLSYTSFDSRIDKLEARMLAHGAELRKKILQAIKASSDKGKAIVPYQ
ncbi:hypothetical protein Scep_012171 [Stephania cephalantha]|uniref:Uncharacterized protein n=1 Tax=Stephania cephalantha TaxID=152367 RepID=A0AAP0JEN7_9MAGN